MDLDLGVTLFGRDKRKFEWADNEPFEAVIHAANNLASTLEKAKIVGIIYGSDLEEVWSESYGIDALASDRRVIVDNLKVNIPPSQDKRNQRANIKDHRVHGKCESGPYPRSLASEPIQRMARTKISCQI